MAQRGQLKKERCSSLDLTLKEKALGPNKKESPLLIGKISMRVRGILKLIDYVYAREDSLDYIYFQQVGELEIC